ncbi:fructosamine kinase family protein [Nonomuraea wenchangensis]
MPIVPESTGFYLLERLHAVGLTDIVAVEPVTGGLAATAGLARRGDGTSVFVKALSEPPSGDVFAAEVEGLAGLRAAGGAATPEIILADRALLVLSTLQSRPATEAFWEQFAHALAHLHTTTRHPRFGWNRDNWLGRRRQINTWNDDGHEFFAQHRLLRWLGEPRVREALDTTDRAALERLCDRLPELLPIRPACLTHGDLWAQTPHDTGCGSSPRRTSEADHLAIPAEQGAPGYEYADVRPGSAEFLAFSRFAQTMEQVRPATAGLLFEYGRQTTVAQGELGAITVRGQGDFDSGCLWCHVGRPWCGLPAEGEDETFVRHEFHEPSAHHRAWALVHRNLQGAAGAGVQLGRSPPLRQAYRVGEEPPDRLGTRMDVQRLLNRPAHNDPFTSWSSVCAFFSLGFVLEAAERGGPHRLQERHRLGQPLRTQPIEAAIACAADVDEAGCCQRSQMLRYRRATDFGKALGNVACRHLAIPHQDEDGAAGRVRHSAKRVVHGSPPSFAHCRDSM